MKLSELLAGRPDFASKSLIVDFVTRSKNYRVGIEDLKRADSLLIFATSKQHTWLVSTNLRLYCILDDLRKDEPHINWSLPKSRLIEARRVIASIEVNDKSPTSGTVAIGDTGRPWLYTKRLFSKVSISEAIHDLLMKTMVNE